MQIAVLDSDPSVPPEMPLASSSRSSRPRGSARAGLGLSLSEGIAAAHGGHLELDVGARPTRFVLTLKRAAAEDAAHAGHVQ